MNILAEHGPLALLFAFLIAHALADYPLQGSWLAQQKVRRNGAAGDWWIALTAHGLIHAGAVWWVSGSPMLGAVECLLHMAIDHGKGQGRYGIKIDQLAHVLCKVAYVIYLIA